jgi:hypothetical protein
MKGRPTKYKNEYAEQAFKLCLLGATDKELADFFDVNEDTINVWKKSQKGFSESLKKGKLDADAKVASKLYARAIGYAYEEVTFEKIDTKINLEITPNEMITTDLYKKKIVIKEVPPDTTAQIFWLKTGKKTSGGTNRKCVLISKN